MNIVNNINAANAALEACKKDWVTLFPNTAPDDIVAVTENGETFEMTLADAVFEYGNDYEIETKGGELIFHSNGVFLFSPGRAVPRKQIESLIQFIRILDEQGC